MRAIKLNYSSSLFTIICIHLIIIHTILIQLSHCQSETNEDRQFEEDINSHELPEEKNKLVLEKVKSNLLKVLGLKEAPKKPTKKAHVPYELLKAYLEERESSRGVIPDDRDFIGIEVDMGHDEETDKRFLFGVDSRPVIALTPQSEPEDVSPEQETLLPPHSISHKNQKNYSSVHMKFNLSQELFTQPLKVEEFRGAVLKLTREPPTDFDSTNQDCGRKPLSDRNVNIANHDRTKIKTSDEDKNQDISNDRGMPLLKPRFQNVYILRVTGLSKEKMLLTHIANSQRIDTCQSTPISFDISDIIKAWIREPSKNYGIIIRVGNDDKETEELVKKSKYTIPNASTVMDNPQILKVEEHVRLKRVFRSTSESEGSWIRKQPQILVYASTSDATRLHYKRDYPIDDTKDMQSDDPETSTSDITNSGSAQNNPSADEAQISDNQTSKHQGVSSSTTSPESRRRVINGINRRDRNSSQSQRNSNPSRPSSANGGQKPRRVSTKAPRPEDKCSKRSLSINFDAVGWSSWIIAPQAYLANYCFGDCSFPISEPQNATNHAIIQSIFHSVGRVVPRSCCAPTKLGKISILYQLDGSVQMRHYDDMIVESCGCL